MKSFLCILLSSFIILVTYAQSCTYPYSYNNIQVWGLTRAMNVTSIEDCINAACSETNVNIWQYCNLTIGCGGGPAPYQSCFIGSIGSQTAIVNGWISNSSIAPPTPKPTPSPMPFLVNVTNFAPNGQAIPNIIPVTNPENSTITLDTVSLIQDGKRILPLGGEMHMSRVPRSSWETDLAKMKAGGIDIVNGYIFWIHIEEIQGNYNFSDNRDIRAFALAVQAAGMKLALRIGPWSHGEARSGGFPDFIANANGVSLRSNTSAWLDLVKPLYVAVAEQIKGLSWKEGGPIISIQLENETPNTDYLLSLKAMAEELAIDPGIFFTITAWPQQQHAVPIGTWISYAGGYTDQFWGNEIAPVLSSNFLFSPTSVPSQDGYPYMTVESGGGMASSYHRRLHLVPADIAASAQIFLANGAASIGFYMYHGGTDPTGINSTMQESQLTHYPNDLPMKTYDFHAPIAEAGHAHAHYHYIRRQGIMQRTYGSWIVPMLSYVPNVAPTGTSDNATLRWGVRSDGIGGLIFVSNVQNFVSMESHSNVRLTVALPNQKQVIVPDFSSSAITIPAGSWAAWPFNMPIGVNSVVTLLYAIAQPLSSINGVDIFFTSDGIVPEFAISSTTTTGHLLSIGTCSGSCFINTTSNTIFARGLVTGYSESLSLIDSTTGDKVFSLLLLDNATSARAWVAPLAGTTRLFISDVNTSFVLTYPTDISTLSIMSENLGSTCSILIMPPPSTLTNNGQPLTGNPVGLLTSYQFSLPVATTTLSVTQVAVGGAPRIVPTGPAGCAQAPNADGAFGEFVNASVWSLQLDPGANPLPNVDVRLLLNFSGDVARLYLGNGTDRTDIIADWFYNGHEMVVAITRQGIPLTSELFLRVLPLGPNPMNPPAGKGIYFEILPPTQSNGIALDLQNALLIHTITTNLTATN